MAAPILCAPGIFAFFPQENRPAHKIPRLRGGGGVFWGFFLGGECRFYCNGCRDFSESFSSALHHRLPPPKCPKLALLGDFQPFRDFSDTAGRKAGGKLFFETFERAPDWKVSTLLWERVWELLCLQFELFYLQVELFAYSSSFFARNGKVCLKSPSTDCKQRSSTVSKKGSNCE